MKSLHIEVGRGTGHRSQRIVRITFDGMRKVKTQLTLPEIRRWAAMQEAGAAALGIKFSISYPAQRTPCDTESVASSQ